MTWRIFVFDCLKLMAAAAGGVLAYAVMFQLLVMTGILTADLDGEGYGHALTQHAVLVWLGSIIVGFVSVFIRAGWRWPLLLAPLYAPALYALIRASAG